MRPTTRSTATRCVALTIAPLFGLAACGSDDTSSSSDGAATADSASAESDSEAESDSDVASGDDVASGGSGTATLTVADGTTYDFGLTTCETSNTDDFELPDSYDIFGATADGAFSFQLGRAGLDETFVVQVGALEGDFDDEGKNAAMLYNAQLDNEPLNVDGAIVSGTFMMRAIGPTRPHGDEVEVTLDARC